MVKSRPAMSGFLRSNSLCTLIYLLYSLAHSPFRRHLLSLGAGSRSMENNRKAYASNKKGHLEHALNGREDLMK
jgi:hypothetical protein